MGAHHPHTEDGPAEVDVDALCTELRAGGTRVTPTLRAVLAVLAEGEEHLTAADVATRVREADPGAHLSTVYRTLDRLLDRGVVDHVHVGHGPAAFHLRRRRHDHLACIGCGAVVDVPSSDLDALAALLRERHGFRLQPGHVALSGWCEACTSAGRDHPRHHSGEDGLGRP